MKDEVKFEVNCAHQFISLGETTKAITSLRQKYGVKVICALCGEIRDLWPDGEVTVHFNDQPTKN